MVFRHAPIPRKGPGKQQQEYFNRNIDHDIHTLECMFHVSEIYLTHVISIVERKKGSEAMEGKALLNNISAIQKSMTGDLALAK